MKEGKCGNDLMCACVDVIMIHVNCEKVNVIMIGGSASTDVIMINVKFEKANVMMIGGCAYTDVIMIKQAKSPVLAFNESSAQ